MLTAEELMKASKTYEHGYDDCCEAAGIPGDRVVQFHLAGHNNMETHIVRFDGDLRVAWPKLPRASSTLPALSSGGLENERTTPRATFRRGQLSLQSN
jgi:hypothetical protein